MSRARFNNYSKRSMTAIGGATAVVVDVAAPAELQYLSSRDAFILINLKEVPFPSLKTANIPN